VEDDILRIEENGPVLCECSPSSHFVCVWVPVRSCGEGARTQAIHRYRVGSFVGRSFGLVLEEAGESTLTYRVPLETFRARDHLLVEVLAGGATRERKLWSKRFEMAWQAGVPILLPLEIGESSDQRDAGQ
jgi:hypothetical protein